MEFIDKNIKIEMLHRIKEEVLKVRRKTRRSSTVTENIWGWTQSPWHMRGVPSAF